MLCLIPYFKNNLGILLLLKKRFVLNYTTVEPAMNFHPWTQEK